MSALWLVLALAGAAEEATLTGTITWSNPKPPEPAWVVKDRAVCGREGPILSFSSSADERGRLREAIVYLEDAKPTVYVPIREVVFDQRNCTFVPHVAATTRGSIVRFKSSDPALHNVRVLDAAGKLILNYAMPVMDQEASYRPAKPQVLTIQCDVHTWMRAYVKVFDHAFFTASQERGRYTLTLVPPGAHKLVAWHPDIGQVVKEIVVPEDPKAVIAVDLSL